MSQRLLAHLQGGKQKLPAVPVVARLSERVHVALGMNPGPFSLQGTNTYVVGLGERRILIDTGDVDYTEEYIPVLKRAVQESGAKGIEQVVLTHWHRDHIGGARAVIATFGEDIPVRKFMPVEGAEPSWSGEGDTSIDTALAGCRVVPLGDGEVLRTEGATLRAVHTPGHANDHVVLVLEEEGAMFTGDNVLGTGTPVFRDLPLYLQSLRRMLAEAPRALFTSHGPMVPDGSALIEEYIGHRTARIEQVRDKLRAAQGAWCTAEEITRTIYTQHPENLIIPATGNTVQALRVLLQDRAVLCDQEASAQAGPRLLEAKWRAVPESSSL